MDPYNFREHTTLTRVTAKHEVPRNVDELLDISRPRISNRGSLVQLDNDSLSLDLLVRGRASCTV